MTNRSRRRMRRLLPYFMAGGVLCQMGGASGCQAEATQLTAGLLAGVTSSIINQLISDRIAELLNAPGI